MIKYRPDIDGLRALAVIPVILFHAGYEYFDGGFIGVDIFFVISGYLISTIIINELDNNNFSLVNFYERRARRILPALFFLILVCIPFSYLLLLPEDLLDFSRSVISVSLFSSNFLFWIDSGYFETASELKPLLHTWSLAVEEQYYILFPLFLMITWSYGKKTVLILLFIIGLFSLFLADLASNFYENQKIISGSFFLLPTRAWELLIGVIIALYLKNNGFLNSILINQILSLLGFSLIIISFFVIDESLPFPSLYALAPTIGTGLIIMAAVEGTFIYKFFSLKPIVGMGLISYSAYLYHQPILAFARHRNYGEISDLNTFILCLLSVAFGYISWKYVEKPFRDKKRFNRKEVFSLSLMMILIFSFLGAITIYGKGFPNRGTHYDKFKINNFTLNNNKLQIESWSLLKNLNNDNKYVLENFDFEKESWFSKKDVRKKLLLVGNSHSKDMFNVLTYSNDGRNNFQIARFGLEISLLQDSFFSLKNYNDADIVMIVSRYLANDLKNLVKIAERVIKDNKKLVIVRNIFEFKDNGNFNLADQVLIQSVTKEQIKSSKELQLRINQSYTDNYHLKKYPDKERENTIMQSNIIIDNLKNQYSEITVLNRMKYICDNERCSAADEELNKFFFDYSHHTIIGAKYFGQKVDEIDWLKNLY
ncbi:acyltransferase [Gammaproteobacteria bacterium]|nr:acyltransferase [Gammaproteobacteria bacterium]